MFTVFSVIQIVWLCVFVAWPCNRSSRFRDLLTALSHSYHILYLELLVLLAVVPNYILLFRN